MNWSPNKTANVNLAPFQGRRRAFSVFFAVFIRLDGVLNCETAITDCQDTIAWSREVATVAPRIERFLTQVSFGSQTSQSGLATRRLTSHITAVLTILRTTAPPLLRLVDP